MIPSKISRGPSYSLPFAMLSGRPVTNTSLKARPSPTILKSYSELVLRHKNSGPYCPICLTKRILILTPPHFPPFHKIGWCFTLTPPLPRLRSLPELQVVYVRERVFGWRVFKKEFTPLVPKCLNCLNNSWYENRY